MHYASWNGYSSLVKMLLELDKDRAIHQANTLNDMERTPMSCAAENGHTHVIKVGITIKLNCIIDKY